jgi:hypothetical protein
MMATPTKPEMDEQLNQAYESKDAQGSKWPGMSYEDGVIATLNWVTGETSEPPMEDE